LEDVHSGVLRHLKGELTIAAAPLQRVIVVDVDIRNVLLGEEASNHQKQTCAREISLILGAHAIPHTHFDSRRGTHTWIRLEQELDVDSDLKLLERRLGGLVEDHASVEVRPDGGMGIRLPFGTTLGRRRSFFERPHRDEEMIAWLRNPTRASPDAVRALLAGCAHAGNEAAVDVAGASSQVPSYHASHEVVAPLTAPAGFERWCICKKDKFVRGLETEGERHWTYLMVAAEAALHADLSEQELVDVQLSIPDNDLSNSSDAECLADARQNAKDILGRIHEGRALMTGCAFDNPEGPLRATFSHLCTLERSRTCRAAASVDPEATEYKAVLRSTLWRGSHGSSRGLGGTARVVYADCVRRAHGRAGARVHATGRYLEGRLKYVTRKGADAALRRLSSSDIQLLIKQCPTEYALAPPLSTDELRQLEERLGTWQAWSRSLESHRRHWEASKYRQLPHHAQR
jgi:hypothetical protein